jgi:hypothetical protein
MGRDECSEEINEDDSPNDDDEDDDGGVVLQDVLTSMLTTSDIQLPEFHHQTVCGQGVEGGGDWDGCILQGQ